MSYPLSPSLAFEKIPGSSVSRIKGRPDLLLRTYAPSMTLYGLPYYKDAAEALQQAQLQRKHLSYIQKLGIAVPRFATFVGLVPTHANQSEIGLYTAVEAVEHAKVDQVTHASTLASKLLGYTEWIRGTNASAMLDDIYYLSQYCITTDGALMLLDIGPNMRGPNTKAWNGQTYIDYIKADLKLAL